MTDTTTARKKKPTEVGNIRADGAVCVKVEWVAKERATGRYYPRDRADLVHSWKKAYRFDTSEGAEASVIENAWKAIPVFTWRKPKASPTATSSPPIPFPLADRNRAALLAIAEASDRHCGAELVGLLALAEEVKRYLEVAR